MENYQYNPVTGGSLNQAQSEPTPMLDEFVNRIKASSVQVSFLFDRMRNLGDRAFGAQPEPGTADEKVPLSGTGAVDRVFLALNELDMLLARLEGAQSRIDGLA